MLFIGRLGDIVDLMLHGTLSGDEAGTGEEFGELGSTQSLDQLAVALQMGSTAFGADFPPIENILECHAQLGQVDISVVVDSEAPVKKLRGTGAGCSGHSTTETPEHAH